MSQTYHVNILVILLIKVLILDDANSESIQHGGGSVPGVLQPLVSTPTAIGALDVRDYCLHESLNASCRHGSLILMVAASYGRMKLGRCISGEYNMDCSKDLLAYFDAQCTARPACDVSVRNLVDIHPCQRDFMSYLQASYKCVEVAALGLPVCPRESRLTITSPSGYLSNAVEPHRAQIGSMSCPWVLQVRPGQTLQLRIIVLHSETRSPAQAEEAITCSDVIIIKDNQGKETDDMTSPIELNLCSTAGGVALVGAPMLGGAIKSRERHLYASIGHEVTLYVVPRVGSRGGGVGAAGGGGGVIGGKTTQGRVGDGQPAQGSGISGSGQADLMKSYYKASSIYTEPTRFVISYEAIGCPDLTPPPNAWIRRTENNIMIKCNDTQETWYFTCQRNTWIGDIGNCSLTGGAQQRHNDENMRDELLFPTHGIVLAVLIGVLLGVFIGVVLLVSVHCVRQRSKRILKKRQMLFVTSHGGAGGGGVRGGRPERGEGSSTCDYSCPDTTVSSDGLLQTFCSRSRVRSGGQDSVHYPALLVNSTADDRRGTTAPDMEKLYEFSSVASVGGSTSAGVLWDHRFQHSPTHRSGGAGSCADYQRATDNNATTLTDFYRDEGGMMYTCVQPCPLCVSSNCQCLTMNGDGGGAGYQTTSDSKRLPEQHAAETPSSNMMTSPLTSLLDKTIYESRRCNATSQNRAPRPGRSACRGKSTTILSPSGVGEFYPPGLRTPEQTNSPGSSTIGNGNVGCCAGDGSTLMGSEVNRKDDGDRKSMLTFGSSTLLRSVRNET